MLPDRSLQMVQKRTNPRLQNSFLRPSEKSLASVGRGSGITKTGLSVRLSWPRNDQRRHPGTISALFKTVSQVRFSEIG